MRAIVKVSSAVHRLATSAFEAGDSLFAEQSAAAAVTGRQRHKFGIECEIPDLSNLQQTVLMGFRGIAQNQRRTIRELRIRHSMHGKVYDSEVGQWQSLERSLGGVGSQEDTVDAADDAGNAHYFLAASGQIRELDPFHIEEIGSRVFPGLRVNGSGHDRSRFGKDHTSDAEKSRSRRLDRSGLPQKMKNGCRRRVRYNARFQDVLSGLVFQRVKRQKVQSCRE